MRRDLRDKFHQLQESHAKVKSLNEELLRQIEGTRAELGYDVARTGHLASVWINRPEGDKRRLVGLVMIQDMKFGAQRALIEKILSGEPQTVGGGDKTGLGMQVCEELEDRFGTARFIGMNFSAMKPELGTNLVRVFEDNRQILPSAIEHDEIRNGPVEGARVFDVNAGE